jgi:Cft2 family RNA processing exonuclease
MTVLFSLYFDIAVIPLDLKQTVQVDKDLVIHAYYAGHVCFFIVSCSVYSTLDYLS